MRVTMADLIKRLIYIVLGSFFGLLIGSYLSGGIAAIGTVLTVVCGLMLLVSTGVLIITYFTEKEKQNK
jgi:hypothetical protein